MVSLQVRADRVPAVTHARVPLDDSPIRWLLLVVGITMAIYAWKTRQPYTTSDFTIFYVSAQRPAVEMYKRPVGPPRGNMNAPHFQLMLRPLTMLPLSVAAEIWRGLNILALCGCMWWLARKADDRWTAADVGAALAWAPFHHTLTLNQVTWIMWPLLVCAWWCWRRDRWTAGAIAFGIALSFKAFLGVFLLWLAVRRQWRAAAIAVGVAAAAIGIGLAVYGIDVGRAWVAAMTSAEWPSAFSNASLRGLFARTLTHNPTGAPPLVEQPSLEIPLFVVAAVAVIVITLLRTRTRSVDESWPALMASALLASPLGWVYYVWWMLPGTRPSRVLFQSPLFWIPMIYMTWGQPSRWATLTTGSMYCWALLLAWGHFVSDRGHGVGRIGPVQSREIVQRDAHAPAVR